MGLNWPQARQSRGRHGMGGAAWEGMRRDGAGLAPSAPIQRATWDGGSGLGGHEVEGPQSGTQQDGISRGPRRGVDNFGAEQASDRGRA
eukprot:365157-Chlamydomonas_euryale.AAC.40